MRGLFIINLLIVIIEPLATVQHYFPNITELLEVYINNNNNNNKNKLLIPSYWLLWKSITIPETNL